MYRVYYCCTGIFFHVFFSPQGDYAWNRTSEPLPENVRRTTSWAEVDAELDSILKNGTSSSSVKVNVANNSNSCSSTDGGSSGSGGGTSNSRGGTTTTAAATITTTTSSNGCKANGRTVGAAEAAAPGAEMDPGSDADASAGAAVGVGGRVSKRKTRDDDVEEGGAGKTQEQERRGTGVEETRKEA